MQKSGLDGANVPEIVDIVMALVDFGVIEKL
jgi:hypothetical protein